MTITVTGPDGSNVSFPDGTPHADIAAAMDSHFGPKKEAAPKETPGVIEGVVRSAAEGVPILGGTLNSLDAATNALLSYANGDVKGNWSERYAEAKKLQDAKSKNFADAHPILDTAAGITGGVASGGALLKAAPVAGARILGLTGETLPAQMVQGAVSGGAIGAADSAIRGDDAKTGGEIGAITGAVAPIAGRAIARGVEAVRGMRQPPLVPANTVDIAGVPVRRSAGQASGDTEAITREQMALRGNDNSREQAVARDFFGEGGQKGELAQAQDAVAARMHPQGEVMPSTPQESAEYLASHLADRERASSVAAQRAADELAQGGQNLHLGLGGQQPGAIPHAANPLEAAGIVGRSVGQAAENARAARNAGYQALADSDVVFHPAAFNGSGQRLRQTVDRTAQIDINPESTPIANQAVNKIDSIMSSLAQQRDEAGRIIPKPPITPEVIEDVRKRLNVYMRDARASAIAGKPSDAVAMREVINAFDDLVEQRIAAGTVTRGDPAQALELMQNARALHAEYRRTFTPQGAGDKIGRAIEQIVGRHEGQAMTPEAVGSTLYGNTETSRLIGQRFNQIFGPDSHEVGAIKQGFFAHHTLDALGNPLAPEKAADNLQKAMRGSSAFTYFSPQERAAINAHAERLRASVPREATDVENIVRRVGRGELNGSDLARMINTSHGGGRSERLVQLLKGELPPEQFAAVKNMQWRWLNENKTGPLDVGSKAVVSKLDAFLDGAGKPVADAMYTAEERALLRTYRDLMREITPPAGTVNYSNTASVLGKMVRGTFDNIFGGVGLMHGVPGMIVGHGADLVQRSMRDSVRAAKVARSLYGTPQSVNAISDLQRQLGNLASFTARTTQPALTH